MKKGLIFLVISALLIAVAGTALAAKGEQGPVSNVTPENVYTEQTANNEQPPTTEPSDEDLYQQMYQACHGPNGYMSRYFGDGNVPQGYGGMMGGYRSNTNGNL